jgi:hypothetical protein
MSTKNWASIWRTCALAAGMLMLTGCCITGRTWPEYEIPSQPDYLYLPQGAKVQTRDGVYQARENEKWVNPKVLKRYQDALSGTLDAKEEAELKELLK